MSSRPSHAANILYVTAAAVPALLSFWLFRLVRSCMSAAKAKHAAAQPETCRRWHVFSRELFARPLALPLIMTTAPRWNPHAVIGAFGPVEIRRQLALELRAAPRGMEWFFVVYRHPDRRTVGVLTHLDTRADDGRIEFQVPEPGHYAIGARFYHAGAELEFPAVRVDGDEVGAALTVKGDVNAFYHDLHKRENLFYRCLAFHLWVALRARRLMSASWLQREFLPVGNPETTFAFGLVRRGEALPWKPTDDDARTLDIYVTFYSRSSLPVRWFEMTDPHRPAAPETAPTDGFYLVRMHPRARVGIIDPPANP